MGSSLTNLDDNFTENICKIKCKDCDCLFFNMQVSMTIEWIINAFFCNKNYSKKIDENFKNWFKNTFNFSNDTNKFNLSLSVYPYE